MGAGGGPQVGVLPPRAVTKSRRLPLSGERQRTPRRFSGANGTFSCAHRVIHPRNSAAAATAPAHAHTDTQRHTHTRCTSEDGVVPLATPAHRAKQTLCSTRFLSANVQHSPPPPILPNRIEPSSLSHIIPLRGKQTVSAVIEQQTAE